MADSGIVAYLSIPILSPRAADPIATLCVVDFRPRSWTERDVTTLTDLAAWALSEIELRAGNLRARIRAEEALQESEARYRALTDLSPDATWIDQDGFLVYANRAAARVMGADDPGELLGREALDRVAPEFQPLVRERIRRIRDPNALAEMRFRRLDGSPVEVESAAMGIHGPVTEPQQTALHRIQASQRHLLGLINEVLNYAKLETGTVRYDLGDVPIQEMLATVAGLVEPQARACEQSLTIGTCPPELRVRADAEKLRQILVNLLGNAIKFTERGGRVDLTCERIEGLVLLVVRDTGIGVPPREVGSDLRAVRAGAVGPRAGWGEICAWRAPSGMAAPSRSSCTPPRSTADGAPPGFAPNAGAAYIRLGT